jgi:hypothetical protein
MLPLNLTTVTPVFNYVARQKNKRNKHGYPVQIQRARPDSTAEVNKKNRIAKVISGGEEEIERKKAAASPLTDAVSSTVSMPQFRPIPRKEPLDIVVIQRTISRRQQTGSCPVDTEDDDTSICSSSCMSELSFVSSSCSSSNSCLSPFLQQSSSLSSSFSSQESSVTLPTKHKNVRKCIFQKLKKLHSPNSYCAISSACSSVELPPPRNRTKHKNYVLLSTATTFSSASCSTY